MSSGYGLSGTVSRCYFHFEDMAKCMVRRQQNRIGQQQTSFQQLNRSLIVDKSLNIAEK
jgi:hypothetical protein